MKIKEEIKKTGAFWIPPFPEPVRGVLSISNERGIEMEVAQSLVNDPASILSPFRNLDNVFQVIGHIQEFGFLILDGCYISNSVKGIRLFRPQISTVKIRFAIENPNVKWMYPGGYALDCFNLTIKKLFFSRIAVYPIFFDRL